MQTCRRHRSPHLLLRGARQIREGREEYWVATGMGGSNALRWPLGGMKEAVALREMAVVRGKVRCEAE
jgi:hypothetical protein